MAAADLTTVLTRERSHHELRIRISHPKLWWPHGSGDPKLYSVRVVLSAGSGTLDEYVTDYGIRTVELIRDADKAGRSFMFRINGRDIFIRGANIIPADYFVSRVSGRDYEELTDNAIAVNMNMLRAWGGAVYEDEHFYRLCDRKGILVWQDFMFACCMYPSDDAFLRNVEQEVRYQVARLRNHPSVILWCGNNEVLEGFHTWGWKEELGEASGPALKSYDRLFHELIPGILGEMDPTRPYWPSSPSSGDGDIPSLKSGDFHYWDIVKEILPITVYRDHIGRFMSEYGFKSYPDIKTIRSFTGKNHAGIHSELMESHQGWPGGAELVEKNLEMFYKIPEDFRHFIYLSQLLQAEAIKGAIESHRRAKPLCMGSLYWQLNDCWPSATWSGIDYYGRWKALHYHLKTAFSDILISAEMKNGTIRVFLVSDLPENIPVTLCIRCLDFSGKELYFKNIQTTANANRAQMVFSEKAAVLHPDRSAGSCLLDMKVFRKNHQLAHNVFYFTEPKNLELDDPALELKWEKVFDKIFLFMKSPTLVKNIFIDHPEESGFFSDNYFDLFPGEEKIIIFQSDNRNPDPDAFSCLSLYDVFHSSSRTAPYLHTND